MTNAPISLRSIQPEAAFPARPRLYGFDVRTATVKAALADVEAYWATRGVRFDEGDTRRTPHLERWEDELVGVIGSATDPYAQAKSLERDYAWRVDSDLVLLLDRVRSNLRYVHRALVRDWAMEHGVRFPAKKGDIIAFRDQTIGPGLHKGEVATVIDGTASAIIAYPVNGPAPTHFELQAEAVAAVSSEGGPARPVKEPVRPTIGFRKVEAT